MYELLDDEEGNGMKSKVVMTAQELKELDLAYAPPYSSAKDPVNMAAENPDAVFASINLTLPCYPEVLEQKSIVIQDDIDHVIDNML